MRRTNSNAARRRFWLRSTVKIQTQGHLDIYRPGSLRPVLRKTTRLFVGGAEAGALSLKRQAMPDGHARPAAGARRAERAEGGKL